MRTRFLPASCIVALLLAAPPLAQAQSMLNLAAAARASPVLPRRRRAPRQQRSRRRPPCRGPRRPAAPAPANRAPVDMQPTDALFDAINRGDIATARDAISRGADLQGQNILGMTPLELSIDLGRNDISFLLLSMRAADDGRSRQAPAEPDDGQNRHRRSRQAGAATSVGPGRRIGADAPRRRRAFTAATVARRTRMPGSWGSIPAGADGGKFILLTRLRLARAASAPHMAISPLWRGGTYPCANRKYGATRRLPRCR